MTYPELQIQLDLNPDNQSIVLVNVDTCRWTIYGYLFVDQEDGQCYLFDKYGQKDDVSKVRIIDNWAFFNCTSLKSIKIPDSVKRIKHCVFKQCTSLTNIDIPHSIEIIETETFESCMSLKSIEIPDSIKNIEKWAFYNCISLTSIKIPDSVKQIEAYAFYNCTSLTSIKIPSSVESIGFFAFKHCISLKEVVFEGKTMKQVKAMSGYPWGIEDKSVIKVES